MRAEAGGVKRIKKWGEMEEKRKRKKKKNEPSKRE